MVRIDSHGYNICRCSNLYTSFGRSTPEADSNPVLHAMNHNTLVY